VPRILHVLTQRPGRTGSGVTLDALVRRAAARGHEQRIVVGVPASDAAPAVGGLGADRIDPLVFDGERLPFPVPGMSDVMPYPSTRFGAMTAAQLATYRAEWSRHLARVVETFRPELIHAHHVWIVGALVKDVAPGVPVVTHCHATGLRQMELCPHLAPEVRAGCARNDAFVVLRRSHADELAALLGVPRSRVHVVGAGYDDALFHARRRPPVDVPRLVYVGKYAAAKGLPVLLDVFEELQRDEPRLELHVAGSGGGPEAAALERRMRALAPAVHLHGMLDQPALAQLLRRCAVCVLPSFYEGVPLVLVEALACGCRLVATALPGVVEELAPRLGAALRLVNPPRMAGVDRPVEDALPAFARSLHAALDQALAADGPSAADLAAFTWDAVFTRIERVWDGVLA